MSKIKQLSFGDIPDQLLPETVLPTPIKVKVVKVEMSKKLANCNCSCCGRPLHSGLGIRTGICIYCRNTGA